MPSPPLNRNLRSTNKTTEGDQQTTERIIPTESTQHRTESVGTTAGTCGFTTTGTTGITTTGTSGNTTGTKRVTTVEIDPESDTHGIIQRTTMQQQDQAQQNPQIKRQVSALISPIAILFWRFIMLAAFIQFADL
ncbi:uncharacterized protein LOC134714917 [Mytilus trossulus]|uniref:uncharacterized protein LOC134714917 n=1 Tax=Mytilus trossulus TaxID=6551 RepID=UPI003006A7E3